MKEIVQSVDRALSIIEVLSDYEEGLALTEISTKIKLHKSTVHRLLGTLIQRGYVEQNEETNKYKLTLKLFELGNKLVEKMDILPIAKPYLKRLGENTNEVVHLVLLEDTEIVYIDKVESENTIRMHSRIGSRSPAYCTAVGKAILAHLPDEELEEIWERSDIKELTKYTITNLDTMKKELEKIRERGYSIDNEENELGVRCVAAPIFNFKGEVCAAVSVSGPIMRITQQKIKQIAKLVMESCKEISRQLGYRG